MSEASFEVWTDVRAHDPRFAAWGEASRVDQEKPYSIIREQIAELNQEGRTVFLTTHDIDEADRLCDRVAIIVRGKIAAIDTPDALKQAIERTRAVEVSFSTNVERDTFIGMNAVERVETRGNTFRLITPDPDAVVKAVVAHAEKRDLTLRSLQTVGPSLEDAFVALTEENS